MFETLWVINIIFIELLESGIVCWLVIGNPCWSPTYFYVWALMWLVTTNQPYLENKNGQVADARRTVTSTSYRHWKLYDIHFTSKYIHLTKCFFRKYPVKPYHSFLFEKKIKYGVPRDSNLGPTLFILYISMTCWQIKSFDCSNIFFLLGMTWDFLYRKRVLN